MLEALAAQMKFRAHIDPSLAPLPVTETLKQVSIDEVLDRLLTGANYAWIGDDLYVWPQEGTPPSQSSLETNNWTVVSAQQPVAQAPPSLETLQHEAVEAVEPADRFEALETLMEHGDIDTVVSTLQAALKDEEAEIRAMALEGLEGVQDPKVQQAIIQVVQHDPVADNRAYGLVWLAENAPQEAIKILQAALHDDSTEVQELAKELLSEIQSGELDGEGKTQE